MAYVDEATETLAEAYWSDVIVRPRPVPADTRGRFGRFFDSMVASMSIRGQCRPDYERQPALTAGDMLAQRYPHLYLQATCG